MKFTKYLVAGVIGLSLATSVAMADYDKGMKYYKRYITRTTHIKATQMLKILGVQTPDQMKALFKDNAKPLIEKLKAAHKDKAVKAVEKIIKKHKLKDLEDFLVGVAAGKIPAG